MYIDSERKIVYNDYAGWGERVKVERRTQRHRQRDRITSDRDKKTLPCRDELNARRDRHPH